MIYFSERNDRTYCSWKQANSQRKKMEVLSHKAVLDQFQMIMHQYPIYSIDSEHLASSATSLSTLFAAMLASDADVVRLYFPQVQPHSPTFLALFNSPIFSSIKWLSQSFPHSQRHKKRIQLISLSHPCDSFFTYNSSNQHIQPSSLLSVAFPLSVLSNDISVWQTGSQTDR